MGPEASSRGLEGLDALRAPHTPPKPTKRPGGRQMLAIAITIATLTCAVLWIGLWLWDRCYDNDPYDNPDNWGDQ